MINTDEHPLSNESELLSLDLGLCLGGSTGTRHQSGRAGIGSGFCRVHTHSTRTRSSTFRQYPSRLGLA